MIKKYIAIVGILGLIAVAVPALAYQSRVTVTLKTSGVEKNLVLPPAAGHSSVISLGTGFDPGSGQMVEGYAIIHYAKDGKKSPHAKGGKKGPPSGDGGGKSQCYGFLSKGAKWKVVEDYMVDTTNSGLSDSFVRSNLAGDIDKWESASGKNIIGTEITNTVDGADTNAPDNKNEVYFDTLDSGTIGVTIVWGIFGGRPANRMLVEWDQVYNTYYQWSDNGEAGKMDFENIATHELGHSVGLGDLYDTNCAEETMYGYGALGETKKHSLEAGDIAGIAKLYK